MIVRPKVPLTVDHLPFQRLVEVTDLSQRPASFTPTACRHSMPGDILPKRLPRQMAYLGTVEWAWSPVSSRIEALYLHRARRHWILWRLDPFANEVESEWTVVAFVERRGVSQLGAAHHLVIEAWTIEAEEHWLDHFHWVSEEGQLSAADWRAIGRVVWPPEFIEVNSRRHHETEGDAS